METIPTKSGWRSSEFISHMLLSVGIAVLTALGNMQDSLPAWAKAALAIAGPIAIGWMQTEYNKGRNAVKLAMIETDSAAVSVLKAQPPK